MTVGRHCDRCGEPLTAGAHAACARARALEPPRYCGRCGRRLKVQVLPYGWHATCSEHGPLPKVDLGLRVVD